jgi:sigma-B regulation protein RsbU (phosphoserine phosphatase)
MKTDIPKQLREDFFRTVVDTVNDPVTLVGKDFKILYVNKMVSKIYGAIVGELCYETLFGFEEPCEDCLMLDVLKDGKPKKKIGKFELPSGRIVWAEANAAPFKNAEGEIIGVIDTLRDITEQKEARDLLQEALSRLNAELSEAADYVKSLLPSPIVTWPLRADWRFVPSASLGGDSFGYHWLDENHFAIYLVDVSGHGVGAALLSVSVINALRSHTLPKTDFQDPQQVLHSLNINFPAEQHNDMFFTIWYGVYNKSSRNLMYASGGHPPALLFSDSLSEEDNIAQLRTPNFVIGGSPDATYKKEMLQLNGPARLYVFSDGVYDITEEDGSIWGFEGFLQFMQQQADKTQLSLDRLFSYAQQVNQTDSFEDDFTILEVFLD